MMAGGGGTGLLLVVGEAGVSVLGVLEALSVLGVLEALSVLGVLEALSVLGVLEALSVVGVLEAWSLLVGEALSLVGEAPVGWLVDEVGGGGGSKYPPIPPTQSSDTHPSKKKSSPLFFLLYGQSLLPRVRCVVLLHHLHWVRCARCFFFFRGTVGRRLSVFQVVQFSLTALPRYTHVGEWWCADTTPNRARSEVRLSTLPTSSFPWSRGKASVVEVAVLATPFWLRNLHT